MFLAVVPLLLSIGFENCKTKSLRPLLIGLGVLVYKRIVAFIECGFKLVDLFLVVLTVAYHLQILTQLLFLVLTQSSVLPLCAFGDRIGFFRRSSFAKAKALSWRPDPLAENIHYLHGK